MKAKARSFRTKLWIYFLLFGTIIFSLLWILQTVFLQSFYNRMLIRNTESAAQEIIRSSGSQDIAEIIDRITLDNSLLVFITDPEGTILYSSDSYKSSYRSSYYQDEAAADKKNENPYRQNDRMNWQIGNYRNLPDGYEAFLSGLAESGNGVVRMETDSQYIYGAYLYLNGNTEKSVLYVSTALGAVGAAVSIIRLQLLWVTALSLLVAFGLAWLAAKRFSGPVASLAEKAKKVDDDEYRNHFQKGFCIELDELSDCLDQTAERLRAAKTYQKELLANVSHDLRTPLTMIKGYAELVRDFSWEDEAQRNEDIGVIIREADRLTALVNEILEYSSLQSPEQAPEFEPVDLGELVCKVSERFETLFAGEGGRIECQIAEEAWICGNRELLERAVCNLLDNAVRHAGAAMKIRVSVTKGDRIRLEIRDYGAGIAEDELPYIWEKYYTSRQRGHKGVSGLGLAIVKEIAVMHDAGYGVQSEVGKGSTFWMEFKKQQD